MLAALPFLVVPLVTTIRVLRSASLDDESSEFPPDAPLVSVVIPARNEVVWMCALLDLEALELAYFGSGLSRCLPSLLPYPAAQSTASVR